MQLERKRKQTKNFGLKHDVGKNIKIAKDFQQIVAHIFIETFIITVADTEIGTVEGFMHKDIQCNYIFIECPKSVWVSTLFLP